MKKYPFSKKAMQAILATTVALAPVVTIGSFTNSAVVQAESTYDDQKQLIKGMLDLVFSAVTVEDLETSIDTFRTTQSGAINTVLPNVTMDEFLAFMSAVQLDFVDSLSSETNLTSDTLSEKMMASLFEVGGKETYSDTFNDVIDLLDIARTPAAIKEISLIADQDARNALKEAIRLAKANNTTITGNSVEDLIAYFDGVFDQLSSDQKQALRDAQASYRSITEPQWNDYISRILSVDNTTGGGGGGGAGGGGGVPTTPTTPTTPTSPETPAEQEVTVPTPVIDREGNKVISEVTKEQVKEIVDQITPEKSVIPIKLEKAAAGEKVEAKVPADLFKQAAAKNKNAKVKVETEEAAYDLPVSEINVAALAKSLGVSEDAVEINIAVNVVDETEVSGAVSKNNLKLASKVIEFTVEAVSGSKTEAIKRFSVYVEREITSDKTFNQVNAVAVRINDDGTITSIPTYFDGKRAVIKSLTNSKYTVVENNKTFSDVNNGANWAEAHIEKLASKYIVQGKTATSFSPDAYMTRGEFAALISRSLGLVATDSTKVDFSDVSPTQAINKNGEIAAAVEAGIIQGKADGKFHPSANLTRAEAAIMISRAIDYVNSNEALDTTKELEDFKDLKSIGSASREHVEKVLQAGIISGYSNGNFGPSDNTKRDQMSKILDNFLQHIKFIN